MSSSNQSLNDAILEAADRASLKALDEWSCLFAEKRHFKIIFTNGCFDVIHPGHLQILRKCRELAGVDGKVIVGLNSDDSVRKLKGMSRPIFSESDRTNMLASLRMVDVVMIFPEETPRELIEMIRPDVIVKGGDYTPGQVVGHDISLIHIVPRDPRYSTTDIVERIKKT